MSTGSFYSLGNMNPPTSVDQGVQMAQQTINALNSMADGKTSLTGKPKTLAERKKDGEVIDFDREKRYGGPDGGSAELIVGDNFAILGTEHNTAVGIGDGNIILKGRTHLCNAPSEIRINGFWVLNEELLTTVPSTLFNPVQTLLYKAPPYAKKASKFMKLMQSFGV